MDSYVEWNIKSTCLILVISVLVLVTGESIEKKQQLKVTVLTPYNSDLSYCVNAALQQAFNYIKDNVSIKEAELTSLEISDSKCQASHAVGRVAELKATDKGNVIIGLPCTSAARATAELCAYKNRPLISWYAPDIELLDKDKYPTLVRTFPPIHKTVKPLLRLISLYEWTTVGAVVCEDDTYVTRLWSLVKEEIRHQGQITLIPPVECNTAKVTKCLKIIKTTARVVLLMVPSSQLSIYMNEAERLGMGTDTDYVFIHYHWIGDLNHYTELWNGPSNGQWSNLLLMSIKLPPLMEYESFITSTIELSRKEGSYLASINKTCSEEGSTLSLLLTGYMYDTLVYYAYAKQHIELTGTEWNKVRQWTWGLSNNGLFHKISGKTGDLRFDESGDRETDHTIQHYQHDQWQEVATIDSGEGQGYRFLNKMVWHGSEKLPADTPACGFDGKICSDRYAVGFSLGGIVVVGAIVVTAVFYYKRSRHVKQIFKKSWAVDGSDICSLRSSSDKLQTPVVQEAKQHGPHPRKRLKRMATRFSNSIGFGSTWSFTQVPLTETDIARYKSYIVIVRSLNRHFKTDRQTLEDLQTLHSTKCDNINTFIGATVAGDEPVVLMMYCEKGCLQNILENRDIKLDSMFVLSFLSDIAKGMQYLHSSSIGSNGNLKSTNCMVDSRWVVKITDIGVISQVGKIRKSVKGNTNNNNSNISEDEYYGGLMWTAPELLRLHRIPAKGTQEGDIYSFSIIMQEVLSRNLPFYNNLGYSENSNKDIIEMVQGGASNGHLCRPLLFEDAEHAYPDCVCWPNKYPKLNELMRSCWEEDPDERPVFTVIKHKLKLINNGGKTQLVDHMVRMLERYADNLEELVEERTEELEQEKQKTDELLHSMLPKQVASKLKLGHSVQPETFDSVSIFFSDIVGFTSIASRSEPLEIVVMLNKLYTLFDKIIGSYEVYKVETIGDAYMVCSGLPERIDYHASEIACMSLDFLDAVRGFIIDHLPEEQLKLRIGLHTGSCVAGVVGIAMPRYCLFGDTVNMASRMESTGEALKIHCSSPMNKELLRSDHGFITQKRGKIEVKGKGKQVTYWLLKKGGEENRGKQMAHSTSGESVVSAARHAGYDDMSSNTHYDDVDPSDSISNAPRRGSDMSGYTEGNAYVLLDLPDLSRDSGNRSAGTSDVSGIHASESIRSIGDISVNRKSSPSSSSYNLASIPQEEEDIGDSNDLKLRSNTHSEIGKKKWRPPTPARKSSFQHAKTAILHGTERIRKRSVGKVTPLQDSLAELSLIKTVPDIKRLISQPEETEPVFVKPQQALPANYRNSKRFQIEEEYESAPSLTAVESMSKAMKKNRGNRRNTIETVGSGIDNMVYTDIPDIRVKDYNCAADQDDMEV